MRSILQLAGEELNRDIDKRKNEAGTISCHENIFMKIRLMESNDHHSSKHIAFGRAALQSAFFFKQSQYRNGICFHIKPFYSIYYELIILTCILIFLFT
jgi:hypothetical protein